MSYEDFIYEVCGRLKDKLGEDYIVYPEEVIKPNDIILKGVMITRCKTSKKTVPIIYLEEYYKKYKATNDIDGCVESIIKMYKEATHKNMDEMIIDVFDWNKVSSRIYPIIMSKKMNSKMLKNLVYTTYLDFAVCYTVRLNEIVGDKNDDAIVSIRVKEDMLKIWDINIEELHNKALVNMKNDGYNIKSMATVIKELMFNCNGSCTLEEIENAESEMYVLTNRSKIRGATGILNQELLEQFAEQFESNFYILPSSVHEVILLIEEESMDVGELNEMVRQINEDQVPREDVLEEHVYYYDREQRRIEMCE